MGDGIQYTYSSYGRRYIEGVSGDLCDMISDVNTLTFKSYSYDSDLGMYYLGSRWYDPEVCRFINADSYVSTGQGITGYNMFAYCGNNPVNRVDPDGEFWGVVGFLLIVGGVLFGTSSCSKSTPVRSDLQEKHRLDINTADPTEYNCYGNATQKLVNTNPTGYQRGDSTAKTFEAVKKDLGGDRNVRKLDSIDDTIREDEYKVAMRTGPTDYHFIRLTEDGWYNKPGIREGTYVDESYVLSDVWISDYTNENGVKTTVTYDGEIIFFAVKIWWDAA